MQEKERNYKMMFDADIMRGYIRQFNDCERQGYYILDDGTWRKLGFTREQALDSYGTEQEKIEKAVSIAIELKTATQETRDAWREKSLAEFPNDAEFIEQAYRMGCE